MLIVEENVCSDHAYTTEVMQLSVMVQFGPINQCFFIKLMSIPMPYTLPGQVICCCDFDIIIAVFEKLKKEMVGHVHGLYFR